MAGGSPAPATPGSGDESTFAPYECPICSLFMTAPARRPMVVDCGHTVCQECLGRLHSRQCPMCTAPITHPAHCFLLSELIDRFVSTHNVPLDANPPTIDAPVPLYRGVCTYAEHGSSYFLQRWYHCNTCGLVGSLGCCQVCAGHCHRGHDVVFSGEADAYCDCGAGESAPCACLQPCPDLQALCTIVRTGATFISQPWFHCETCRLTGHLGCCHLCAVTCHAGHKITGGEYHRSYCDCGAGSGIPCKCMTERFRSHCTFLETRRTKVCQDLFFCRTCGIVGDKYVCKRCARACHAGHVIEQVEDTTVGFCQCGLTCTIKKAAVPDPSPPLVNCPWLSGG
jgi:hypothetical protein